MAQATKFPKEARLLTTVEAAQVLGIAPATLSVWRCTRRQEIPFVKVGRLARYRLSDLENWLAARTVGGASE